MATATPTTEPLTFTAGFSVSWDKSLSDYPATDYLLTYVAAPIAGGEAKTITCAASVNTHEARLTPAQAAQYDAGTYRLTGYVSDIATDGETTKAVIYNGRLTVYASPYANVDTRTFAESVLADLQQTYSALAGNRLTTATVNGRTYTNRDLADLRSEIAAMESRVANDLGRKPKRILVKFTRP
jgi:hypothetical protein